MFVARPWMFVTLCLLLLVYESVALSQNQGHTISEIIWNVTKWHPIVPFALGFLMGHFFFQATTFWKNGQ